MYRILDKLSLRKSDYLASVGEFDNLFLARVTKSVSGMACVGTINKKLFADLRDVRSLENEMELDDGAFDKILAEYHDELSIDDLVRASDHFGMVLITNIPLSILDDESLVGGEPGLRSKFNNRGIDELWFIREGRTFDLLFKVRKYA